MLSNAEDIKQFIKAEANHLGFCVIGFSMPQEMDHYPLYECWIKNRQNAGMAYLSTEHYLKSRRNPASLLPSCKSILSFGALFPNPAHIHVNEPSSPTHGTIASYALGDDYHEVLKLKITFLMQQVLQKFSLVSNWICAVDTMPLPERELAVLAGLGWIGKNGMLISPQFGSSLFLAEVLIDYALPPDLPFTDDLCGTCRRCIDACPTHCIQPDRTLDTVRCLSYLTIEHRGAIPLAFHPTIHDRIFGCDICIAVCPWTIKAKDFPRMEALFTEPLTNQLDLEGNKIAYTEHFHSFFKHSPIRRAGKAGFLRNCIIRLSNSNSPEASRLREEIIKQNPKMDLFSSTPDEQCYLMNKN